MGNKIKNRKCTLRAFGSPSLIELQYSDLPFPATGEVRVKIEASTVSATDIFIRKGIYPLLKKRPPFTTGYDFVGTVDSTGTGVTTYKPGDRVCGIVMTGGNADYICCPQEILSEVPQQIESIQAACITLSGITAYQMFIHYARVNKGERVLIHGGSGAVGDILLQLATLYNCQIVTTASSSKHSEIKRKYGAVTLDYKQRDYWDDLEFVALDGFDAVFDFTNHKSFSTSYRLLKSGGRLVTYAVYSRSLKIEKKNFLNVVLFGIDFAFLMTKIKWWKMFSTEKSVSFYGSSDSRNQLPERHQKDMNQLFELMTMGKIKPMIYRRMRLSDVQQAHQLLESGHVHGQIVIDNSLL